MSIERVTCSFCGKTDAETLKMFAGPRAIICNECVTLLAGMLTEDERAGGPPEPESPQKVVRINWRALPHHQTHGPR